MTAIIETRDKLSGKVLLENQTTLFIRSAGGFGGKRSGKGTSLVPLYGTGFFSDLFQFLKKNLDRGAASAANNPPSRNPDATVEEKTSTTQAALYRYVTQKVCHKARNSLGSRLSGDWNPLHVHSEMLFVPRTTAVDSLF